ncbi:MAG: tRNA preQ1(34) S-adenosylmethionine ribosyltransferase-isomerase QueA [Planctomycetales bacterium]|nr:tRNA preQ1(34) S-adenosylmethionine ribosyltransferase-isomerase QueA [Planctomycetales bacterium]
MADISEYEYDLPKELIAQHPLPNRSDSRLMVVDRASGEILHSHTRDLPDWVHAEDAMVFNDSRVVPARLVGRRQKTGGKWEGLFLQYDNDGNWRILCKTRGKMQPGELISLLDRDARESIELRMLTRLDGGEWAARPERDSIEASELLAGEKQNATAWSILDAIGRVPLPHYIRGGEMVDDDLYNYQTVYAKDRGSVAAPTAGLHFTSPLLEDIKRRRVSLNHVTLHVGIGTFRPVKADLLEEHTMHAERGEITQGTAEALNAARDRGGRIVAIGTTSVRVLESAVTSDGRLSAWSGDTSLFIKPPYQFRAIDALLTNFHLPRSTLLVLVRTFGGDELIRRAYQEAIDEEYRFFSYGDAMLII